MPDVRTESQDIFLTCINRALGILGPTGKAATIFMLERKHGISVTEGVDVTRLTLALREIFGIGSAVLLRARSDELRRVKPSGEGQTSIDAAARQVEDALYGVEHGLT